MKTVLILLLIWNLLVFGLMGLDKRKARKGAWRVKESTLLKCAFIFGAAGAVLGALIFRHKTRKLRFRLLFPLALIVNAAALVILASTCVCIREAPKIIQRRDPDNLSDKALERLKELGGDCILVLGCGISDSNTPSPMLKDRLDTAVLLYRNGVCPKVLVSGDNGQKYYNEVHVMLNYLCKAGIPEEDIFCDHAGFSTYDSMVRAAKVFELRKAVVVTQRYHEFRALYIGEQYGMEVLGVSADMRIYTRHVFRELREVLARFKDVVKCALKAPPRYLGDLIDIRGDGRATWDEQ